AGALGDRPAETECLTPDSTMFILVSFEGPDSYSQAGGLGVRMTGLAHALVDLDYETHQFFIGDPDLPPQQTGADGRLSLHRWSQWISANCRGGVYDGEAGKVDDFTRSLPPYLVDEILTPAIRAGRLPVVMCEEWQTAECACRVSDALERLGLRDHARIAWNANHCYGFDRIDWPRLGASAAITTVSRHMRSIVRARGIDARVIPNGIPSAALAPVARREVAAVRSSLAERPGTGLFFKMARWEREKGWDQALDAVARTRASDRRFMLVARAGGPTGAGGELERHAAQRRLNVVPFLSERDFFGDMSEAVRGDADVVDLRFGVSPTLARTLYAAADGVLANSVSEPFGLVGLEAMAAGGVAYTGGTGEDYAIGGHNAVVLETLDPGEIVQRSTELASSPDVVSRIRRHARKTAQGYEWRSVVGLVVNALTPRVEPRVECLTQPASA
ncbi:MAG: glycosyltransferase family 4 protein, partial [Gemmatimonadaceae bacterium]